jgi:hypothetical protein
MATHLVVSSSPFIAALLVAGVASADFGDPRHDFPYGSETTTSSSEEPSADAAPPPTEPRFGDAGQWVFGAGTNGSIGTGFFANTGSKDATLNLRLSVDRFVARRFSVGAFGSLYLRDQDRGPERGPIINYRETSYVVGGRLGTTVPFGSAVSLWLRFGMGYGHSHYEQSVPKNPSLSGSETEFYMLVNVDASLLLHVVPHFFFAIGPELYQEIAREIESDKTVNHARTYIQLGFSIGGWF